MQSETVWYQANKHHVPRIAFVNKLDRMGADFFACIEQMKEKLGIVPAICTIPAGQSERVQGRHRPDPHEVLAAGPERQDAHASTPGSTSRPKYQAQAEEYREHLLEAASHADDELLELVLEGKPVSRGDAPQGAAGRHAHRQADAGLLRLVEEVPRRPAAARRRRAIILPSPLDRPPVQGIVPKTQGRSAERKPDPKEPFSGLAFKTVSEPTATWCSCASTPASCSPGDDVLNTVNEKSERISHIYPHDGRPPRPAGSGRAGEIVAVVGLKQTHTGNTLCDQDQPIALEEIRFPEPVISQAIIPAKNDRRDQAGRRPGQDGPRRSDAASAAPIRRRTSSSSAAWANCTWKCRSTSCSATTASR